MIRIIYKYLAAVLLLSCLGGLTPLKAQELVGQEELGGRKALVGPDCLVNQFASNVALLGGIDGLENLVDENPDNYATFTTGVAVGVTEQPLFSVKDMKHTYKAGTEAGICMVSSESGGLLSLNVIQLFTIRAYNNGKLIGTYPVTAGQAGSGVGLDLIKIPGTDNLAVNLTCTPTEDFDELYVNISGGLDVSVIKELKFKYAFVGKPVQCLLTDTGIKEYAQKTNQANNGANAKITPDGLCIPVLVPFPIIRSELNKMVDDNTGNSCSVTNVLSIGYKGGVSLSTEKSVVFPAGSEVGFVYQNASALNLKLGNYVDITLYNTDGTEQTERVEAGVLSLVIAEGGKMTSSVIADKEFYKAEISFYTLVSANLGNLGVYYGFVNEPPMLAHRCPINPSATVELCADQTGYQLMSNPEVTVAWSLDESSPCKNNVEVTSSGKVTFTANPSEDGDTYVFRATAVSCNHNPKCYELVTINRGHSYYDGDCSEVIYNAPDASEKFELSDDIYGSSGSLISISELKNPAYILNADWNDYASYVGGLSIASNLRVVGVNTKDGSPIKLDEEVSTAKTKRVGFVVEASSTFLNTDVLQFFQIRCYNDGAEVYRSVVDETNTVGVGLIGEQQSQKVRFSIEVPSDVEFDEFMLWTSGVLKLDLTELRIYYPFIEDAELGCTDPLKCAEMISMANGAMAHPDLHFQTASVAGVIKDLGNLIDGDNSTYFLYQNTVQAGSGLTVKVELGKTMDYHQQLGIIMDNETFLAGVQLGTWMTVETYYQGKATGDKFDNWGVLGLNLIGYGDKNYLICTPTRSYDEVRITFAGIANVLEGFKLYGLFTRNDKNMNGIPDCIDPDQECSVSLGLSVNKICVGEDMTLSGTFPVDVTSITVKVPDQDNFEATVTNASPQTDKTSFSVTIPTVHAGRAMPLLVYDANGKYLDGLMYTVYPNQAVWRVNPLNTDWNEPNNWDGNIEPYCCTNVIVPEGATMYPVLVAGADNPADTYCCDGIYFEADGDEATAPAQVVNIPELAYHKAWVDVEMMPNRYYMFSAPLKNSHTGDLFVPADMNGKQSGLEFTDLDITNCPQNRFNPRVFQRKWHSTLNVRLLDEISYAENADGIRTDNWTATKQENTDWTAPFNALNHTYSPSEGFSVWVDNGNLDRNETVVFRLPKQHAYYNYYTPDGMMLEEYEGEVKSGSNNNYTSTNTSLSRGGNTRFIYEGVADNLQKANGRYESQKYTLGEVLTITATISEAGDRFMVGNPFMSDIDIKTFLSVNQEKVKSLDRYNGTEYVSYTLDASGNLSSAATGSAVIEPLESVVVTSKSTTDKTLVLSFTRDMMLNTVGSGTAQAVRTRSVTGTSVPLYVKITSDGQTSSLMVADSPEAGKSKRLFDSDVKPSVSVSALDEEAVYAIYGTEKAEIPLAIQLAQADRTVTFHFDGAVADYQREWMLADKYTGETYSLEDTITIASVSTNAGRFVLQNKKRMAEQAAVKARHVYVQAAHDGKLEIMSDKIEMKQVRVYGMDGKLLAEQNVIGFSCVVDGLNEQFVLVQAVLADGSRELLKLMIP